MVLVPRARYADLVFNSDTVRKIAARVDHATLLKLHDTPLWQVIAPVITSDSFWKERTEFLVGKSLAEQPGVNWREVYALARLGKPDYELALRNLPLLKAVVDIYGAPQLSHEGHARWIAQHVTTAAVLEYLMDDLGLPAGAVVYSLHRYVELGLVDVLRFVMARLDVKRQLREQVMDTIKWGKLLGFSTLVDLGIAKPSLKHLKRSINRGYTNLVDYLLERVKLSDADRGTILQLAQRRGGTTLVSVMRSQAMRDYQLSTEQLVVMAALYSWIPSKTRALGQPTVGMVFDTVFGYDSYHSLLRYLLSNAATPRSVIEWIAERIARTRDAALIEAVLSVASERLPEIIASQPIRALLLALIYERTIEQDLADLRAEGAQAENLELSRILIQVYRA